VACQHLVIAAVRVAKNVAANAMAIAVKNACVHMFAAIMKIATANNDKS